MASMAPTGAKTPSTLLTLPGEIRDLIWEYCLVSPTSRVLPVYYRTFPAADPPSPFVWTAIRPFPLPWSTEAAAYGAAHGAALRIAFTKSLHLVPCAPTTEELLSPTLLPLAHLLPLVNLQVHAETAGRFWGSNRLVLPDYAAGCEVLAYLGPASQGVQRVEMAIGNVWDVDRWQGWQIIMMLNQLERLVREGALEMLRLKYVIGVDDGMRNQLKAFSLWYHMLLKNREESNWGRCKRELVREDKMKSDKVMPLLERSWGLEEDKQPVTAWQMRRIKSQNW
ncbi:hypothetical protein VC83_06755 [Pseudogymnoascus destructans]|uniref:Uncharacterized protein n=2 Tax=Pseudogymnoascus destructans TaxID=655981 RepID=L8G4Y3_PSED2|nr:uncharacterized protein VC83_06755 [Pseudogymnoascus destructans]ELR07026.1 hypothetical protein GMDG_02348 [Pseudogymnoascus destructans 20631-21]OAF56493.1 hypothetical protein VC83_06755 [Pseudogymnoascus destructans]